MQAKFLISIKTQHQFSQPSSQPAYTSFPVGKSRAKIHSEISSVCEMKSAILSVVAVHSPVFKAVSWVILNTATIFLNKLLAHPCSTASHAQIYII